MRKAFVFRAGDILREAEKRTSVVGKMRGTDKEAHLYDRMALTEGERFLSDEYMKEAAAETYDWIKAFGRGVENAFMQFADGTLKTVRKHFGVGITMGGNNYELGIRNYELDGNFASIRKITGRGYALTVTLPKVEIETGDTQEVLYRVSLHITAGVQGTPFAEERILTDEKTVSGFAKDKSFTQCDMLFKFESSDWGEVVPLSADCIDIEIVSADVASASLAGFTEYEGRYAEGDLPFALKDGTWYEPEAVWYEADIRNAVVYTLEIPEWTDENMLRKVENDLREAMINYVVWRWFETVNAGEAAIYYDKWEEKAHGAQLGLNTEKRVLQRRAVWL